MNKHFFTSWISFLIQICHNIKGHIDCLTIVSYWCVKERKYEILTKTYLFQSTLIGTNTFNQRNGIGIYLISLMSLVDNGQRYSKR